MDELEKALLYRMTHIENIPHILQHGITHLNSVNRNPGYVPIGDTSLISNRGNFQLPNGRKLGEYIPFYFGPRMPMLFVIQNGFNNVPKIPTERIVYCITSVRQILIHDLNFLFSNGHAVDELTDFFNVDRIKDLPKIIDKNAIKEKYWKDDNDLDLKRRKEAEFLLNDDLPLNAILGYAVYNEEAKQKLIALGIEEKMIGIRQNFYF